MCEMVFVGVYCVGCWKAGWTKAPSDARIWTVLFTTYEVLEAETKELTEIEVSMSESDDGNSSPEKEEDGVLTHYFSVTDSRPSSPKIPSGYVPTTSPTRASISTVKRDLSDAFV